MKIIDHAEVLRRLTPGVCIGLMRDCLADLEDGRATQYLRTVTPLPSGGIMGYMPAAVEGAFGAKLITVFPGNGSRGLPSHQGSVLLFDGPTGSLQALADGGAITEVRTGAVSAVATDLLARPDAGVLALIGTGAQARSHLLAIREVRPLRAVTVWSPDREGAERFAREMALACGLPITVCETAREAVAEADIVCTLTPSRTPVLLRDWVRPGTHINAVGACSADARELDGPLVRDSRFYGDSVESVLAESGDYLLAQADGLIGEGHLLGTLGELLLGRCDGRQSEADITVFESLGLAVEDIACARFLAEDGSLRRL